MSKTELKRCRKTGLLGDAGDNGVLSNVAKLCADFRAHNYPRVGVIAFDYGISKLLQGNLAGVTGDVQIVRERGELMAALPKPGVYLMTPETCGGLEFDAVILAGVDEGRVPPPMGEISREGYLSMEDEAFKEL